MKRFVLALAAPLALSGCVVFEIIVGGLAEGLAAIQAENADQPRFAYSYEDLDRTRIMLAVLTLEDQAYVERTLTLPNGPAEVLLGNVSPDGRYLEAVQVEFIFGGELDFWVSVHDLRTGALELLQSDNTVIGTVVRECDLRPRGQALFDDYLEALFEDPADREGVTFNVVALDEPANTVTSLGWTSDSGLVLGYDGAFMVEIVGPDGSIWDGIPFSDTAVGVARQSMLGGWAVEPICDGIVPATVARPIALRDLTVDGSGQLVLDGMVLQNRLSPGTALEPRPVRDVSGPFAAP